MLIPANMTTVKLIAPITVVTNALIYVTPNKTAKKQL